MPKAKLNGQAPDQKAKPKKPPRLGPDTLALRDFVASTLSQPPVATHHPVPLVDLIEKNLTPIAQPSIFQARDRARDTASLAGKTCDRAHQNSTLVRSV